MMSQDDFAPRVLSDEEVEMYLKGDRREVDRLILYSLNRLANCIVPHAAQEEKRDAKYDRILEDLGGLDLMLKRARFVDASIAATEAKTSMMTKVATSSLTWALPLFLAFVAVAVWDAIVHAIKAKLGSI